MSFQISTVADLVALINTANSTSFATTDLTFGTPVATNGTWQGNTVTQNTAVTVTGVSSGQSGYTGSVSIVYDRLNFASLANISGWAIQANKPAKISDCLSAIAYYTGLKLTAADIVDGPITLDGNNNATFTLQAAANSLGWYGSVSLSMTYGGIDFAAAASNTALSGVNYPVPDASGTPGTAVQGPAYLYPYDFTTYQSQFINIAPGALGSTDANNILAALTALDKGAGATLWNVTPGATAWCLSGATVVSNGLNSASLPTNPNYKYVLVLQLAGTVTTPTGTLYLHYNDPNTGF